MKSIDLRRRPSTIVTPFDAVTDGGSSALLKKKKTMLSDFMTNPGIKRRSALINYDMNKINKMIQNLKSDEILFQDEYSRQDTDLNFTPSPDKDLKDFMPQPFLQNTQSLEP